MQLVLRWGMGSCLLVYLTLSRGSFYGHLKKHRRALIYIPSYKNANFHDTRSEARRIEARNTAINSMTDKLQGNLGWLSGGILVPRSLPT